MTRQVLLLGNGLNRAFGGTSWRNVISDISVRSDFDPNKLTIPMPMQAILMTNNDIKTALKEKSQDFFGNICTDEQRRIMRQILLMGVDDILTTNYSYELEEASVGKDIICGRQVAKLARCTKGKVEPKYLMHTYNEADYCGVKNRIWHIHGESRKPDSMILGHYWYGNMLARMKTEMDSNGNNYFHRQMNDVSIEYDCWMDSFILGDVYVLGLEFGTSEIDLWWLLNRKKREKAKTGTVYFFEMRNETKREKIELLKLMDVKVIDFGMEEPCNDNPNASELYADFYRLAIEDINGRINKT